MAPPTATQLAPSLADIERIAGDAYAGLPAHFRKFVEGVVIRVEDFPDEEVEREMELETPFDILGLYWGVSLDQRSVTQTLTRPDMIFLYRRPLLDYWCESGEDLTHLVRHVLIHEIGHHFGLSDDDMDAIETEAEAKE
jgi:predicted Zn-dependent protease with MMP-like domain